MHYKWLLGHIVEDKERLRWVNNPTIYKHTLNFTVEAWWSVGRHYIALIGSDNTLSADKVGIVETFKEDL